MSGMWVYRTLPTHVKNPENTEFITEAQFESYANKNRMGDGESLCQGHSSTEIWYVDVPECRGYILKITFEDRPPVYAKSMCTFTPSYGMDRIDIFFAEDTEDYVLLKELGRESELLSIFRGKDSIEIHEYLELRGFTFFSKKK